MSFGNLPQKILIPITSFDTSLLPTGKQTLTGDALGLAISAYLTAQLAAFKLKARVVVGPEFIEIETYGGESEVDILSAAIDLLHAGNYSPAIGILRGIYDIDKGNPIVLYNLGMALSDRGETDEAIAMLEELVEHEPTHSNGFVALGVAYARNRSVGQAKKAFAEACKIDPKNAFAHRNLGGLLANEGMTDEAIQCFEKAVEINRNDAAAWYGLGKASRQTGNNSRADSALREVLRRVPKNSDIAEAASTELTKLA